MKLGPLPQPRRTSTLSALDHLSHTYSAFEKTFCVSESLPVDRCLTHFNGNKTKPIHRWFSYKEGFSSELLPWICHACDLKLDSLSAILDPFAGVSTSLLSAQLTFRGDHTLKLVGVERNPFVASVARTKLSWQSFDSRRIAKLIPRLVSAVKARDRSTFAIPELSTLRNERVFNRRRLYDLLFARELIKNDARVGLDIDFLLLGWAAIIESASNVRKDGRALRFVEKEDRLPVYRLLEDKWLQMLKDIQVASKELSRVKRGEVLIRVFEGDGRTLESLSSSDTRFDLILYSPPYLNNLDYSEVYKLELWLSEAVTSNGEFRKLRLRTLRSHPSVTFPDTYLVDHLPEAGWPRRIRDALIDVIPHDWRRAERVRTLRAYMDDMLISLRNQYIFARPGSLAVCVVGNSVHGSKDCPIPIATDLLIASLAKEAGFEIEKLQVARYTRRRDHNEKVLREGILILRRPKHNTRVS